MSNMDKSIKMISEIAVTNAGNGVQHKVTSGSKSADMSCSSIAEQVKWFSSLDLSKTSSWTKARQGNNTPDPQIAESSHAVRTNSGASLHDLPNEIISEIASHLDQTSLFAFRRTSKAYEARSHFVFCKTFCRELKLKVEIPQLSKTLDVLACDSFVNQVRSINITLPPIREPLLDISEVERLVENILRRTHKATSISITTTGPFNNSSIVDPIIDQIREAKLPELRSITIGTGKGPAEGLVACLAAYKDTLKSLDVTSETVKASYWIGLLNYIHDESKLEMVKFHTNKEKELWRRSSRQCLAFRNTKTGKVDYFAWGPNFATFVGEQAMKRGVEDAIARFVHYPRWM